MKKVMYVLILVCVASIAGAMHNQQWLILVKPSEEQMDKTEAFAKIDKEARESLKERYVRGSEMASMWMLIVNSNQEDIKETLKERSWIKNVTMCPNFQLTLNPQ